jgi:histidine ammonia-lyase
MYKTHIHSLYPASSWSFKDTIDYVKKVFKTEINSVTDNPNIFIESDQIISGGNFHGQPLALALDFYGNRISELGISEEKNLSTDFGIA